MKKILLASLFSFTTLFATLDSIKSFEGEFIQVVLDDKNVSIEYKGDLKAMYPNYAVWNYTFPIQKTIYLDAENVTIVEPEIEQVIIKKIDLSFDFFSIIKNSIQINKNTYRGLYKDTQFVIKINNNIVKSIAYNDEFDNYVTIVFNKQVQNTSIDASVFKPVYSLDFDIIQE